MKRKCTFLLTALFLLISMPHAEAKQYCGETYEFTASISGQQRTFRFSATYELVNGLYTIKLEDGIVIIKDHQGTHEYNFTFSTDQCYSHSGCQTGEWISSPTRNISKTFTSEPSAPILSGYYFTSYNNNTGAFTIPFPADMTWGPCISDDEKPVISSVSATNIGNTSATINVAATDNTGITKVVIKNGANERVNQTITATKTLNGSYSVTGLTKNTSYTLTVTVSDAAGNTSNEETVTFTTTNTKEPTINSAAHASSTATQIILNVTATDANKYKVVERNSLFSDKILEVSSGTATNGQITITGLSGSTTYNLRVYAMWDGTMSTNYKDVSVTTPLGSQCEGTRGPASGSGTALKYEIMFDGTDVNITLQSANSDDPLETCIVESYINKGSSTTQFANVTATNGIAVATFNRPLGEIEYFRFQYKTRNMSSATSTANGSHETAKLVYYVVGDCQPDPDVPYMKSVTKAGATTSSITLNVSAIVNGGANTVTQYLVSVDGATPPTEYTATNGQITVNGLTANTSYNFEVWALYDVYTSENSKTVTASTNKESECVGTRGHFADATWAAIDYEIGFEAGEMKVEVTCSTQTLTTLQIQWDIPGIVSSAGFENFTNGVYTKQVTDAMIGNPMLIRIQYGYSGRDGLSVTADGLGENSNGIIYYVVGECGCEPDDGSIPVMGEVEVAHVTPTTVTLNVNATDQHSTVTVFELNGKDYYATDGQITIKNLSECSTYNWTIRAKDPSCNISENSVTVTANTTQNHASQARGASAQYNLNTADGNWSIDGNLASRGGSQDTREDVTIAEALNNSIFTVDLGEIRMVNEIDIYWERACATDYELQASVDGNYWSTIRRYTDMPEWTIDAPARGAAHEVYQFYEIPARYLRVKPNMLYVAAKWGMSIWEFEAYGPCLLETKECPVILDVRSVYTRSQEAIISVSAIDHQTVDPTELTYIVTVETDVPNRRTLTNTYTFAPGVAGREDKQASTELTLQGLVPGTDYTISVQAKDPDSNISCNTNSTTIRTGKAEGCTMVQEGSSVIETGDWKPFPDGMTYRVELENSDAGDEFTVTLTFDGKPADMEISTVYFAIEKQATGADCYAGWVEQAMERDGDIFTKTYSKNDTYARKGSDGCDENTNKDYTFPLFTNWPEVEIYFKIESSEGIIHTNYFDYNASEKTCEEYFIIFHEGSQPSPNMNTAYDGSTIPHEIFYYRLLNPGEWTPLCLPFEVDRVSVYDAEDRQYYNLKAKTASKENQFWMRQQVANVSGEDFETSWYDGDDELPRKNVPYNFAVPTTGGYYDNKYIVFHGAANQTIATNFELGARPTQDDQYTLYGNNTLMPQTITNAYKEDDDGAYYRLQEEWTLNPFECYVLASQETVRRMPIIGRWRSGNDATMIDNVTATQIVPEICIYTILGQPIHTLKQCSLLDAQTYIEQNMASGYYVLATENAITKVLIP